MNTLQPWCGGWALSRGQSWVSCTPGGPQDPQPKHQSIHLVPPGFSVELLPSQCKPWGPPTSQNATGGLAPRPPASLRSHTMSLCPTRPGPSSWPAKADRPYCGAPGLTPPVTTASSQPGWSQRQPPHPAWGLCRDPVPSLCSPVSSSVTGSEGPTGQQPGQMDGYCDVPSTTLSRQMGAGWESITFLALPAPHLLAEDCPTSPPTTLCSTFPLPSPSALLSPPPSAPPHPNALLCHQLLPVSPPSQHFTTVSSLGPCGASAPHPQRGPAHRPCSVSVYRE